MAVTRLSSRIAAALLALGLAGPVRAAQPPAAPAPAPAQEILPINLDAVSSEFDRDRGRLLFRNVRITQGQLGVEAETGEATKLDFEDSRWVFAGNVTITNGTAKILCDSAELTFSGHQLRSAELRGAPARFEQRRGEKVTTGRAGLVNYDVAGGLLRLSVNAWLSDGSNEVTGERISYDLQKDFVLAESDKGGKVRMRINPATVRKSRGGSP